MNNLVLKYCLKWFSKQEVNSFDKGDLIKVKFTLLGKPMIYKGVCVKKKGKGFFKTAKILIDKKCVFTFHLYNPVYDIEIIKKNKKVTSVRAIKLI